MILAAESVHIRNFLNYADEYIVVDWSDSQHKIQADIIADLNKVLLIDSEIADTIVSFSVLEHLCEPQTMLNGAFRILKQKGILFSRYPSSGEYMRLLTTTIDLHLMALTNCSLKLDFRT